MAAHRRAACRSRRWAGGYYYWWQHLRAQLPPGIVFGNGRLEADEIDIDTKYRRPHRRNAGRRRRSGQSRPGRRAHGYPGHRGFVEESASPGQCRPRRAVDEANANVMQQKTQVLLAQQEIDRASDLVQKGFQTKEVLDQRQQQLDGANAALNAANTRVIEFAACARSGDARRRALHGPDRRQHAGRAARRPHPVSHRQYRRGASGRRQGLRHARHLVCLHGHLSADAGGRQE